MGPGQVGDRGDGSIVATGATAASAAHRQACASPSAPFFRKTNQQVRRLCSPRPACRNSDRQVLNLNRGDRGWRWLARLSVTKPQTVVNVLGASIFFFHSFFFFILSIFSFILPKNSAQKFQPIDKAAIRRRWLLSCRFLLVNDQFLLCLRKSHG